MQHNKPTQLNIPVPSSSDKEETSNLLHSADGRFPCSFCWILVVSPLLPEKITDKSSMFLGLNPTLLPHFARK
jgi:hypothetical protein